MPPQKRRVPTKSFEAPLQEIAPAPRALVWCAFCISFALPNLVFSGAYFFTPLHPMKWIVAFTPLVFLGAVVGYRLLRHGAAVNFRFDGFSALWLLLLLFTALQPLWTDVRSPTTLLREWFFFASLWLVYVLASNLMDTPLLRSVLWGGATSAALSAFLAEMQRLGMAKTFSFFFSSTSRQYLANTGQANMFALWLAIGGMCAIVLLLSAERWKIPARVVLLGLLAAIGRGLIFSASRSGIAAFVAGFAMISLIFLRSSDQKRLWRRTGAVALLILLAVAWFHYSTEGKAGQAVRRRLDWKITQTFNHAVKAMESEPWTLFEARGTIWATTWTMFAASPLRGVGLGQFKWNYLSAQRESLRRWPHLKWGYTYWAHNEFLQWFAESGFVGGAAMLFLWLWWLFGVLRTLIGRPPVSSGALWGASMVALFLVSALFTRPFHRIENAVWLSLAFAMANREMLWPLSPASWRERGRALRRPLGAAICSISLLGLLYLGNGLVGDRTIRRALLATNPLERGALLEKARKSPMVRDLAEKQLAYYYIAFGEMQQDPDLIALGVNSMIDVFTKQPHIDELKVLRQWATKLRHPDLDKYVSHFTNIPDDLAESAGGGK